jgi:hypothetical protein
MMTEPKTFCQVTSVSFLLFISLSITCFVLAHNGDSCADDPHLFGHSIADWLNGNGILFLFLFCSIIAVMIFPGKGYYLLIPVPFFLFCWQIIGGVALFMNVDCIRDGGPMGSFALLLWCAITFLFMIAILHPPRDYLPTWKIIKPEAEIEA